MVSPVLQWSHSEASGESQWNNSAPFGTHGLPNRISYHSIGKLVLNSQNPAVFPWQNPAIFRASWASQISGPQAARPLFPEIIRSYSNLYIAGNLEEVGLLWNIGMGQNLLYQGCEHHLPAFIRLHQHAVDRHICFLLVDGRTKNSSWVVRNL